MPPLGTAGAVVLGVRPDDLRLTDGEGLVRGRVTVCEPLGAETLVHVDTPGGAVVAKADGRTPPRVGETISLAADLRDLHVFDAASGAAMMQGGAA